jgi:hypothetical protein
MARRGAAAAPSRRRNVKGTSMIAARCPRCHRVSPPQVGPGVVRVLRGRPDGRALAARHPALFEALRGLRDAVATKASRARYSAAMTRWSWGRCSRHSRGSLRSSPHARHFERPSHGTGRCLSNVPGTSSRRRHPRLGAGHGFRGPPRPALPTGGRGSEAAAGRSALHGGAGRAPGGFRDHRDTIWSPSVAGAPHSVPGRY